MEKEQLKINLEVAKEEIPAEIEMYKGQLDRCKAVKKLKDDGLFNLIFGLNSRKDEIANVTSFLYDPKQKEKMERELFFHAMLEPYFNQVAYKADVIESIILGLEEELIKLNKEPQV